MKQTAVDFLIYHIRQDTFVHSKSTKEWNEVFQQSKAMEKEQAQKYAEFAIECDRKGLPILEFDDWLDINTNEKGGNK
jgi:hypothetical protein